MLTRHKEINELIVCSYHNWYEDFKKNCIKSYVLPIPEDVLKYLKDEFFILPRECLQNATVSNVKFVGEESNFDDEDTETTEVPEFTEFSKQIQETLNGLGNLSMKFFTIFMKFINL
jgi:predicted RNA methylase